MYLHVYNLKRHSKGECLPSKFSCACRPANLQVRCDTYRFRHRYRHYHNRDREDSDVEDCSSDGRFVASDCVMGMAANSDREQPGERSAAVTA
jgi:hypothetical protein